MVNVNTNYGVISIEERPSIFHDLINGEWVYNIQRHWDVIRLIRNQLLLETDRYMLQDSNLTEVELENVEGYRKELRQIPQDYNLPVDVMWPEKPEGL